MGLLLPGQGRVLIASEGTLGTDAIDLANNLATARVYLDVDSITWTPNAIPVDVNRVRGSASSEAHGVVLDNQKIDLVTPWSGAIAVGTTEYPNFAALMKCTGHTETLVSSTSATYKPSTAPGAGVSMYYWQRDGEAYTFRLHYGVGIRGQLSQVECNLDQEAKATWELYAANLPDASGDTANFQGGISEDLAFFDSSGLIDLDKTGSAIIYTGAETYDDAPKFICKGMTVTIDSQTMICSSVTMRFPRTIKIVRAVTGDPTTVKIVTVPQPPTLDFVLQEGNAGYEKIVDRLPTGTEVAGSVLLDNGSGNDQCLISYPKLQVRGASRSEDGGYVAHSISCIGRGDYGSSILGDNDYSIVWSQT